LANDYRPGDGLAESDRSKSRPCGYLLMALPGIPSKSLLAAFAKGTKNAGGLGPEGAETEAALMPEGAPSYTPTRHYL
jgi:hypothetical protein